MSAALSLAEQGFPVHLVEKQAELGGNLRFVHTTFPGETGGLNVGARSPANVLRELVARVRSNNRIQVHLQSEVVANQGFLGNFTTTLRGADGILEEIPHGATILATGAEEYRGNEYGFGEDPQVITQQQFEALLEDIPGEIRSVAMILCIGPAQAYCSRICCSVALKNALALKERHPDAQVTIFYKDIRTYGFKERLYEQARRRGVVFVRYDDDHPLQITHREPLLIEAWDAVLERKLSVEPDFLVLSMPVVPSAQSRQLAGLFKAAVDEQGFFLEAHIKLRPVDFASEGVFMAGSAHYPKLLDETLVQAQSAAARAARVLSRENLQAGGRVAVVDAQRCTACLTCVRICPFNVPKISSDIAGAGGVMGAAVIEAAVCQGCGLCAGECPARAIQLMHYTDEQMCAKVNALIYPDAIPVRIEPLKV
jgi:heterodisulfide reductase subunit A-like polyferredoxin